MSCEHQQTLFGHYCGGKRYESRGGATRNPIPDEMFQIEEYERVMGYLPDIHGACEQFTYNPRTKTGKELLKEMTNDA